MGPKWGEIEGLPSQKLFMSIFPNDFDQNLLNLKIKRRRPKQYSKGGVRFFWKLFSRICHTKIIFMYNRCKKTLRIEWRANHHFLTDIDRSSRIWNSKIRRNRRNFYPSDHPKKAWNQRFTENLPQLAKYGIEGAGMYEINVTVIPCDLLDVTMVE